MPFVRRRRKGRRWCLLAHRRRVAVPRRAQHWRRRCGRGSEDGCGADAVVVVDGLRRGTFLTPAKTRDQICFFFGWSRYNININVIFFCTPKIGGVVHNLYKLTRNKGLKLGNLYKLPFSLSVWKFYQTTRIFTITITTYPFLVPSCNRLPTCNQLLTGYILVTLLLLVTLL